MQLQKVIPSLIISTYNWPIALGFCLDSVLKQSVLPLEIIIADDGSTNETRTLIYKINESCSIPIKHIWHEDKGFRKTIILNKAILAASSPYIIQIDGDIILDRHFIEDHLKAAEYGCFIRGTRTMLNQNMTKELLKNDRLTSFTKIKLKIKQPGNAIRLYPHLARFFSKRESSGEKVKGCNMAFWKKDLIDVNGYNNLLTGWGHEDEELSWRLTNLGIHKKVTRFTAICYHIYHPYLSRKEESHHLDLLKKIKQENTTKTLSGIESLT